jgi:hypothetical protein
VDNQLETYIIDMCSTDEEFATTQRD